MFKHCLASEAVMRSLARELGRDEATWALAGLLHDLDVELTDADLAVHGRETVRILKEHGIDPEIVDAIRLHNEEAFPGERRSTIFQHALAAGETVTGLITATALVYPDKKLSSVKASSVVKRMKEKAFARSVTGTSFWNAKIRHGSPAIRGAFARRDAWDLGRPGLIGSA
jgi:putative nucleotidyltransferase with HDIG domain